MPLSVSSIKIELSCLIIVKYSAYYTLFGWTRLVAASNYAKKQAVIH